MAALRSAKSTAQSGAAAVSGSQARRPFLADPRPLYGFFTRLPGTSCASLDAIIRAFPLVPLVGWVTGLLGGAVALLLAPILPAPALAAVLLTLVVGLTGLNQTDGLLDLGDGLMVHGDAERRLQVMHDPAAGVGAIGAVLFTYLVSYGALVGVVEQAGGSGFLDRGSWKLAAAVAIGEVVCRTPYPMMAWRGRSSHGGLGSAFMEGFGPGHLAVGLLTAAPVVATGLLIGWPSLALAVAAAVAVAAGLLRLCGRLLGGVGGDAFGASQELARAAVLVALSVGMSL